MDFPTLCKPSTDKIWTSENSFCIILGAPKTRCPDHYGRCISQKTQCPDTGNHYGRHLSHLYKTIFSDGVAPSFEQIGIAVQSVIAEASEADSSYLSDEAKDTVLSSEYQLIMTWCWLNIRVNSLPVLLYT